MYVNLKEVDSECWHLRVLTHLLGALDSTDQAWPQSLYASMRIECFEPRIRLQPWSRAALKMECSSSFRCTNDYSNLQDHRFDTCVSSSKIEDDILPDGVARFVPSMWEMLHSGGFFKLGTFPGRHNASILPVSVFSGRTLECDIKVAMVLSAF
jgi:hypothetical protein